MIRCIEPVKGCSLVDRVVAAVARRAQADLRTGDPEFRAVGLGAEPSARLGSVLRTYYETVSWSRGPLGPFIMPVSVLTFALAVTRRGTLSVRCPVLQAVAISWAVPARDGMAVMGAMAISSLWIAVMRNHAVFHTHFLPRVLTL